METLKKTMSVFLLLGLWLCTLTAASPLYFDEHGNRSALGIVGGSDANIADYPYQAALLLKKSLLCGASILSKNFILTAAHCVSNQNTSKFDGLQVRVGTSGVTGGQVVEVKKINVHPSFNALTVEYDVAVVELATPLVLGTGVKAVTLPYSALEFKDGEEAVVTGFGKTSATGSLASVLQKITVALITTDTCKSGKYDNSKYIKDTMFCAFAKDKDQCRGDSGGPLDYHGIQIGIISFGDTACRGNPKSPGVYTKITSVLPFIKTFV